MKKILFLVNWEVKKIPDNKSNFLQSSNYLINGEKYWFFKRWPDKNIEVDVVDFFKIPFFHEIEKKILRFYILQTLKVVPFLNKYDLIMSHGGQSAIFLAFIRSFLGIKDPPHIIIDVGALNGGRNSQPELKIFQFALRSVSGIIYHVKAQKKHYDIHFPFLAARSYYVPFGVDEQYFKPKEYSHENYILSIGYKNRDWETLIAAFSRIKTDTVLKIVGPKKLKIRLEPNICVKPYVPIKLLKELIAKAKFIVIPLVNLPYAHGQMTLLQSMAMGKAVIVTNTASSVDYVKDGEDAILVKRNDVQDMKNKIEFLLNNPDLAIRIGENARKSIQNKFTEKHMAEGIYEAIKKLEI